MLFPIIFSVALWLRKVKMQQFRCKPEPRYKLRNVKKSMKCHTNHNFGGLVLAGRVAMCPTDRKEPAGERSLAKGVQRGSSVPSETETTLAAPLQVEAYTPAAGINRPYPNARRMAASLVAPGPV